MGDASETVGILPPEMKTEEGKPLTITLRYNKRYFAAPEIFFNPISPKVDEGTWTLIPASVGPPDMSAARRRLNEGDRSFGKYASDTLSLSAKEARRRRKLAEENGEVQPALAVDWATEGESHVAK